MEHETVVSIALVSGILGFVMFCVSYTFHVWRLRNASVARQKPSRSALDYASLLFGGMCIIGLILLIAIPVIRELPSREGVLSGDGLFTIRADQDLTLEYMTEDRDVGSGDLLARFRSPDHQARIRELELKQQILETQKLVLQQQPLVPDHEIVRRYQQADSDRRQLLSSWLYLLPERAAIAREMLRYRLDQTETSNRLDTDIEKSRWQLKQATAQLDLERQHVKRKASLSESGALAPLEYEDQVTEVAVLEAEAAKLSKAIEYSTREKEFIDAGLPQFQSVAQDQLTQLDDQAEHTRRRMEVSKTEQEDLGQQLDDDLSRAAQLRKHLLEQIDLEIKQCRAQMDGLQGILEIKAPFSGQVAYADPAPQTALPREPLVVLTPQEGFRLTLRIPESEIAPLSKADEVTLSLVEPGIRQRFAGNLHDWEALPHEPGYALAQLICQPHTETIRDLTAAEDDHIKVRLVWRPPLYSVPMFLPTVILIAIGAMGWGGLRFFRSTTKAAVLQTNEGSFHPQPWLQAVADEDEPDVSRLQELGSDLREAIVSNDIDPALLGLVEDALGTYNSHAAQALLLGLDHDPELSLYLARYLGSSDSGDGMASVSERDQIGGTRYRLLNIIKTIAPQMLVPLTGDTSQSPDAFRRHAVQPMYESRQHVSAKFSHANEDQ